MRRKGIEPLTYWVGANRSTTELTSLCFFRVAVAILLYELVIYSENTFNLVIDLKQK